MNTAPFPCTLRQLQYAVAVAETLSFRQAAERCHVSQPSLSVQLALMEEALGIRLFERDKRKVLVTPGGREIIERARLILRATDDLVALAHRASDPFSGTLRLGVIPTISPYLLPLLTPVLRKAYPRLSLSWIEDKTKSLLQALLAGTLDAALLALEADIGDVEREIIAKDPFVLVAPRNHALAKGATKIRVDELRRETVLVLEDGHCFGQQAAEFCLKKNAHIDAFRATSLTTLVQMVAGGVGITLLPELALPYELKGTHLCVRYFDGVPPSRTIGLVWRKQYPLQACLRHLAATIREGCPASRAARRVGPARASRGDHIAAHQRHAAGAARRR